MKPATGRPVPALDRATAHRSDDAWLATALRSGARLVPVYRGKNLVDGEGQPLFPPVRDDESLAALTFLGLRADGAAYFAVDESAQADEAAALAALAAPDGAKFVELRFTPVPLAHDAVEILLYARALEQWTRHQRFCSRCGAPTKREQAGHVATCTACGTHFFPRTDAAMIVLVHDRDRCLLGRQPTWPKGMYSTLAGFVEAGETLEESVVREVREESGIEVTDVRYAGSQPWPFPQSLMLGFYARALTTDIVLDDELEDARWFSRAELDDLQSRQSRFIKIDTMAMRLIRGWLATADDAAV